MGTPPRGALALAENVPYRVGSQTPGDPTPAIWKNQGQAWIARRAQERLLKGHLWVYRSDVQRCSGTQAGVVDVWGPQERFLGQALYSPASQITLRMLSMGKDILTHAWLMDRLQAAWVRRKRWVAGKDAYRWIHGEADFLPGIFVDRYANCVVIQTTCEAADHALPALVEAFEQLCQPTSLVIRNDSATRSREGLPRYVKIYPEDACTHVTYHEGPVAFELDLAADQKTGGFLDQSYNHLRAADCAFGKALDCFTYHGGFALHMAASCTQVMACDTSRAALDRAQRNADRSGLRHVSFVEADVFKILPALFADGKRFNTLVLDPPAFASTQRTLPAARRAYQEINTRAMKLLHPHGILITCSCSGRLKGEDFDAIIFQAARDARRSVHMIERRSAGPDHPVLGGMPETDYLKCRMVMVI